MYIDDDYSLKKAPICKYTVSKILGPMKEWKMSHVVSTREYKYAILESVAA